MQRAQKSKTTKYNSAYANCALTAYQVDKQETRNKNARMLKSMHPCMNIPSCKQASKPACLHAYKHTYTHLSTSCRQAGKRACVQAGMHRSLWRRFLSILCPHALKRHVCVCVCGWVCVCVCVCVRACECVHDVHYIWLAHTHDM